MAGMDLGIIKGGSMKFLQFIFISVFAVFLVCDPQAGVETYNVDVDGIIFYGVLAEVDGSLQYPIDALPSGQHLFTVQPVGQGGWEGPWYVPTLSATKPGDAGNVRIESQ